MIFIRNEFSFIQTIFLTRDMNVWRPGGGGAPGEKMRRWRISNIIHISIRLLSLSNMMAAVGQQLLVGICQVHVSSWFSVL